MIERVARALPILAGAFVAGTLIATMPHSENEPCLGGRELEPVRMETVWWPLATRCVYGTRLVVDLGPSVAATLAWIMVCAVVFAVSRSLRVAMAALAIVAAAAFLAGWPPALMLSLLLLPVIALWRGLRVAAITAAVVFLVTVAAFWFAPPLPT